MLRKLTARGDFRRHRLDPHRIGGDAVDLVELSRADDRVGWRVKAYNFLQPIDLTEPEAGQLDGERVVFDQRRVDVEDGAGTVEAAGRRAGAVVVALDEDRAAAADAGRGFLSVAEDVHAGREGELGADAVGHADLLEVDVAV